MTTAPVIAAFDVATVTGVCFGAPGNQPTILTFDMRRAGTARPRRLAYFHDLCLKLFAKYPISQVRYEAPLPIRVAYDVGASEEVLLMLRGAIGVLEAAASAAGIDDIGSFSVNEARKHLTGFRMFPKVKGKSTAKAEVMKMCRVLGVKMDDDNQADAYAGWSLCCALANPRTAHLSAPLFARA